MRHQYQVPSHAAGVGSDPNKDTFMLKQMDNVDNSIKIDMMMMSPKQHRNVPTDDVLGNSDKTILETDLKYSAAKH